MRLTAWRFAGIIIEPLAMVQMGYFSLSASLSACRASDPSQYTQQLQAFSPYSAARSRRRSSTSVCGNFRLSHICASMKSRASWQHVRLCPLSLRSTLSMIAASPRSLYAACQRRSVRLVTPSVPASASIAAVLPRSPLFRMPSSAMTACWRFASSVSPSSPKASLYVARSAAETWVDSPLWLSY